LYNNCGSILGKGKKFFSAQRPGRNWIQPASCLMQNGDYFLYPKADRALNRPFSSIQDQD
jgi:hypothetical protein